MPVQSITAKIARNYLQSLDLEVGFLRRGQEIAEQFSADEMAKNFIRAFNGMVFGIGEILVFDFHGQNRNYRHAASTHRALPIRAVRQCLGSPKGSTFPGLSTSRSILLAIVGILRSLKHEQ